MYILESTCSILPNGTPCITFFQFSSFGKLPKTTPLYLKNNGPFIIELVPFAAVSKRVPVQKVPNENEIAGEHDFRR